MKRKILIFSVLIVGLLLMTAGIMTGKYGASVIGLIVAGVTVHNWIALNRNGNEGSQQNFGSDK